MGGEGGHLKLPRTWVYLTHPLGYDPYDSLTTSYVVNTEQHELLTVKEGIVTDFLVNQAKRAEAATAGTYAHAPGPQMLKFDPAQTMPELPL